MTLTRLLLSAPNFDSSVTHLRMLYIADMFLVNCTYAVSSSETELLLVSLSNQLAAVHIAHSTLAAVLANLGFVFNRHLIFAERFHHFPKFLEFLF